MLRLREHDVLIAGAGPAGAHTALRLARRGWHVGLLDARTFPREKLCGEFLSPACLPLLDELGLLEGALRSGAVRVNGMNFAASERRAHGDFVSMGHFQAAPDHGLGIRREVLDAQAVAAAQEQDGLSVLLGWKVSAPLRDERERVRGLKVVDPEGRSTELRARFVIGADGTRSRVARGMGWSLPPPDPKRFAVVARFDGVEARHEAEVHVIGRDYFAACPIDAGLFTANLVVDAESLPKGAAGLEGLFRERLTGAPGLAALLAGTSQVGPTRACGPLRAERRRCTGPGLALVGDACGFVDPLTGEGLYFAMRGASLLASAVDRALLDPDLEPRARKTYERDRQREFAPRYALARLLQQGLRRPGVAECVVEAFGRRPGLCDLTVALTGDYLPPRALLSPGVWRSALQRRSLPRGRS